MGGSDERVENVDRHVGHKRFDPRSELSPTRE